MQINFSIVHTLHNYYYNHLINIYGTQYLLFFDMFFCKKYDKCLVINVGFISECKTSLIQQENQF